MEGRRQFFDSIIQFGWITSEHAKRKLNTYPESDRRMRVMLSARTLFRRCRSRPGKNFSVRRVCDRPWGATEIPRQSFYSSSRPDVTLLSTPFETAGSLARARHNTIRGESETRTRQRERFTSTSTLRGTKIRFLIYANSKPPNGPPCGPPSRISLDSNFKGGFTMLFIEERER